MSDADNWFVPHDLPAPVPGAAEGPLAGLRVGVVTRVRPALGAEAARQVRAIARPGTVIALPTVPCVAPRIDAGDEEVESFRSRTLRLTCIAGLSGLPQMTIPAGLSLIGWPGGDESLLALAAAL